MPIFFREKMYIQRKLAKIFQLVFQNFEEKKLDELFEKSSPDAYHAELAKKIFKFKIRDNNDPKETLKILYEFFGK